MEKENNASFQLDFVPKPDAEPLYPWEDVTPCYQNKLEGKKFIDAYYCRLCRQKPEKLVWINFKSPQWTWKNMCGVAGYLSICPDCGIQVQFILDYRN
jgi:hypothetical protein